jgi:hypothetical protein
MYNCDIVPDVNICRNLIFVVYIINICESNGF